MYTKRSRGRGKEPEVPWEKAGEATKEVLFELRCKKDEDFCQTNKWGEGVQVEGTARAKAWK